MKHIKIQSISDVITNSSSEVFCRISSDYIEEIYELLSPLFPDGFYKNVPGIDIVDYDDVDHEWIEISLPYILGETEPFFKAGIPAVLDTKYKGKYTIEYVD